MKKLLSTLTLSALLVSSLSAQERDRDQRTSRGKPDQAKIENFDWDRVKERIEGAVKRGDMTRDQANQKYTELKKKLAAKPQVNRDQPLRARPENSRQGPGQRRPDALGKVLGELIAQNKINREDARKIFEAAYASRPQMPVRHDRTNPQGKLVGELRDVLNQAREELEEIREAREDMQRHHEEREHHRHAEAEEAEIRERENAERMERAREAEARERAEMMRKRAEREEMARMKEQFTQQAERAKREFVEKQQMLDRQRRQHEEARRELEKQTRERKRKSEGKE